MQTQVVVVGAGGTGLMLATELALAGVPLLVLDVLPGRNQQSRAGALQPRSAELLELRGLLQPVLDRALEREPVGGHFAGLPVPLVATSWPTRHPATISIPQERVEAVLEERLAEHGAAVLRRHELIAVAQDADGVTATVRAPAGELRVRGQYLVGCDGGHSRVRKLLGIGFPGEPGTFRAVSADVVLTGLPDSLPTRSGHFSQHVHTRGDYWTMLVPLGEGLHRAVFGSPEQLSLPRQAPVTEAEVRRMVRAVFGPDADVREVRHASRFSDATRQVERYRHGRVLLAGDAAHIHSPIGGQGLNLGLQDAANLGWKLAITVRGWAPDGLLDSYHDERHPVAARVLRTTLAQRAVMGGREAPTVALREILTDLLRLPEANHHLAGMISGLDLHYDLPGSPAHPMLGRWMPDVDLTARGGLARVSHLTRSGRGLLLDLTGSPDLGNLAARWAHLVEHVQVRDVQPAFQGADADTAAVLVRPDGYVCWASTGSAAGLAEALCHWFAPSYRPVGAAQ